MYVICICVNLLCS